MSIEAVFDHFHTWLLATQKLGFKIFIFYQFITLRPIESSESGRTRRVAHLPQSTTEMCVIDGHHGVSRQAWRPFRA